MENTKLTQERDDIIRRLKAFFATAGMKAAFAFEDMAAKDRDELDMFHGYLRECESFLSSGKHLSIPALPDMEGLFSDVDKGAVLSVEALFGVLDLLTFAGEAKRELLGINGLEHLLDEAYLLDPVEPLRRELERCLDPELLVSDHASEKLYALRDAIRKEKKALQSVMNSYLSRYSKYLTLENVTLKGGMETLPVRLSDKGMVKGSVVGYSQTGETVYMVPYEVLDRKNNLTQLEQEESEEVLKILSDLSQSCQKNLVLLRRDYAVVERLDRFFGATAFGHSYDGSIASLSEDGFELKAFFHPLLKSAKVVDNDLALGKEKPKVLLITGPNAGGKSILIRAVGLSVLMDRMGLFVPAHGGARLPFVGDVFYLGGDNQSVLDNLSTFSSHLLGIKEITENATKDSLVIIDEVGEGTSPRDGEALGVAILKFFEKLGSFTLLTSHFDGMKNYALEDNGVLSAAMEFQEDSLSPTYRLLLGTSGNSYGLLLAKKMGLDASILQMAKDYNDQRADVDVDAVLEKLNAEKRAVERREQELIKRQKDLEHLIEKREGQIKALNEEKSNIHLKAKEKIDNLVQKRLAEIDAAWKKDQASLSFSEVSKAKGTLHKILDETPTPAGPAPRKVETPDFHVGDRVEDEDHRIGLLVALKKENCTIDYDGLKIQRKVFGLKAAPKERKAAKKTYVDTVRLDLTPSRGVELNIIGLHVDEAMREVVSFLDSARLRKFSFVRIVHGAGTFALKNAVWKYLSNHKEFVQDYRLGGEGEGGLGATVVHLK